MAAEKTPRATVHDRTQSFVLSLNTMPKIRNQNFSMI